MRRRLLVPALAALCAGAAAGAAPAFRAADPLQGTEWFLGAVGAAQTAAPGPGTPLTIVDSGVDASQPDFAGRPATTYLNAQTVTGPGEFHGTEVASVAAAPANGVGIVGVYPAARLDVWDVTPATGGVQPAPGVAAAACPGVIELSLGATQRDPQLEAAIAGAQRRGCLVVAAAGNDAAQGNPTIYPAAYFHVLAVGASDETGARASFSSYGPWVDLLAPGTNIEVDTTLEHDPSGNVVDSGTSFSAAIVAAAAAWVWTERPSLTASQLYALLRKTAVGGVVKHSRRARLPRAAERPARAERHRRRGRRRAGADDGVAPLGPHRGHARRRQGPARPVPHLRPAARARPAHGQRPRGGPRQRVVRSRHARARRDERELRAARQCDGTVTLTAALAALVTPGSCVCVAVIVCVPEPRVTDFVHVPFEATVTVATAFDPS